MSKVETATKWMIDHANDNRFGYDQTYRWGERNDYDCSSAVISAWRAAGLSLAGASYTGNMYNSMVAEGFKDVTAGVNLNTGAGLVRGDVLLNHRDHVAMYIGNGQEVEASINEFGGATGGQPGDQTGWEFLVRGYRNYPWNCVLRYPEAAPQPTPKPADWKAKGTAICTEDEVNLRKEPAGEILGQLNKGQRFEVDGAEKLGWTHAYVEGIGVCWIYSEYVEKDVAWKATGTATIVKGVTIDDPVNVRATPNGQIIGTLISGQRFEIDGKTKDGWVHVKVAGIGVGYIYGAWVKLD